MGVECWTVCCGKRYELDEQETAGAACVFHLGPMWFGEPGPDLEEAMLGHLGLRLEHLPSRESA